MISGLFFDYTKDYLERVDVKGDILRKVMNSGHVWVQEISFTGL
jgi:hypothetical protein